MEESSQKPNSKGHNRRPPKLYCPHEGTIRIAAHTDPGKAAGRAISLLRKSKVELIDFFIIGGAANQQAMKSMGLFRRYLEDETDNEVTLAFSPIHVRTMTVQTAERVAMKMNATVWRTIVLTLEQKQMLDQTMKDDPSPDA